MYHLDLVRHYESETISPQVELPRYMQMCYAILPITYIVIIRDTVVIINHFYLYRHLNETHHRH